MGQIIRCPLVGTPCMKEIIVQEKTFFLAEAEKPEPDKKRRNKAISEAIADGYKIRSALEEKGINAFTCKICEMIQTCAYGLADISQNNANVFMELGMMLALGKPTIILTKKGQEEKLKLPSDLVGIEVIPFEEYLDIIEQIRKVVPKLPPSVSPTSPIQDLEKIKPQIAQELKGIGADIVKEFKSSIEEAKLDTISVGEEKKTIPPEISKRLMGLEEKLEDLRGLGFITDPQTAFLRGNYSYNQEKYKEALANYNWVLELEPDDPYALNNRGITYCHLERYEEALADFNRSLELRLDPDALNNRGVTYRHLKKYDEALADFNRALEIKPDHPSIFLNRANTYENLKRYDEALADFKCLLEINPDDYIALRNRGIMYSHQKRYEQALSDFNRALELKPDDASTFYNLACLFSLWEKTDEALDNLEKAIKGDEKYREMAKTDNDFGNIGEDLRFKKLTESD